MRDLKKLSSDVLDVLVVGGGAHGATVAYHAAKAGYATAIVEKNDFCGATSANSLKIIHGGLRYLQHGNIKRMRQSILARREMMQLAPHLVQPLACMMPLHGNGLRGKRLMQIALLLNDCIGWDRNHGLAEDGHLPRGHIVSAEKCLEVIPWIEKNNLTGAAVWYDGLAIDSERLIIEYILAGIRHGAKAANYVKALALKKEADDLYRVTLCDQLTQEEHQVKTRIVVNAAGPWFEQAVQGMGQKKGKQKWALSINLVSKKKIFDEYAVALEGMSDYEDKDALLKRGKRLYFFVPWRGYTMIGTEYEVSSEGPDNLQVKAEQIRKMIDGVNSIYPHAVLKYEDISFYHAGLMPIQDESDMDNIQLEKNSSFVEHVQQNFSGVISIRGVKFTTAPYIAGEVVDCIKRKLQPREDIQNRSGSAEDSGVLRGVKDTGFPLLEARYGQRAAQVLSYTQESEGTDIWIDEMSGLLKAEVRYLIHEEMVCRLSDIVLRRTGIGTAECPSRDLMEKIAVFMGNIFAWDESRRLEEIDEVMRRYRPLHG
jgi:glycerol-3-phosphate dehydrogenase